MPGFGFLAGLFLSWRSLAMVCYLSCFQQTPAAFENQRICQTNLPLAVADLLVGISAVPSLFFCEMITGCNTQAFIADGMDFVRWPFVYASVMNLCSLVFDRYIAVVKPLKYR